MESRDAAYQHTWMQERDAASQELEDRESSAMDHHERRTLNNRSDNDDSTAAEALPKLAKRKWNKSRVVTLSRSTVDEQAACHKRFHERHADDDDDLEAAPPMTSQLFDKVQHVIHKALDEHADLRSHVDALHLGCWLAAFSVPPALQVLTRARQRAYADARVDVAVVLAVPTAVADHAADDVCPLLRCEGDTQGFRIPLWHLCTVSHVANVHTRVHRVPRCFAKVLQLFATWIVQHSRAPSHPVLSFDTERNCSGIARLAAWDHQFVAAVRAASAQQRRQRIFQLACLSDYLGMPALTGLCCALLAEMGLDQIADWRVQETPYVVDTRLEDCFRDFVAWYTDEGCNPSSQVNLTFAVDSDVGFNVVAAAIRRNDCGDEVAADVLPDGAVLMTSSAWPATVMKLHEAGIRVTPRHMTALRLATQTISGVFHAHGLNELRLHRDDTAAAVDPRRYFVVSAPVMKLVERWVQPCDRVSAPLFDLWLDDDDSAAVPLLLLRITSPAAAKRCVRLAATLLAEPLRLYSNGDAKPFPLALSATLPADLCNPTEGVALIAAAMRGAGLLDPLPCATISSDGDVAESYVAEGVVVTSPGLHVYKISTRPNSPCLIFEAADVLLRLHHRVAVMLQTALVDALDLPNEDGEFAWPLTPNGFPSSWWVARKNVVQRSGHATLDMDVLNCTGDFCLLRFNSEAASRLFFLEARTAIVQDFTAVMGGKLEKLAPRVTSRVCSAAQAAAWEHPVPRIRIHSNATWGGAADAPPVVISLRLRPNTRLVELNVMQAYDADASSNRVAFYDTEIGWSEVDGGSNDSVDARRTSSPPPPAIDLTEAIVAAWFEESDLEDTDAFQSLVESDPNEDLHAELANFGRHGCLPLHEVFAPGLNKTLLLLRALLTMRSTAEQRDDDSAKYPLRTALPPRDLWHRHGAAGKSHFRLHVNTTPGTDRKSVYLARHGLPRYVLQQASASDATSSPGTVAAAAALLSDVGLPVAARRWLCAALVADSATTVAVPELGIDVPVDALMDDLGGTTPAAGERWLLVSAVASRSSNASPKAESVGTVTVQLPQSDLMCRVSWARPSDARLVVEPMLFQWQRALLLDDTATAL